MKMQGKQNKCYNIKCHNLTRNTPKGCISYKSPHCICLMHEHVHKCRYAQRAHSMFMFLGFALIWFSSVQFGSVRLNLNFAFNHLNKPMRNSVNVKQHIPEANSQSCSCPNIAKARPWDRESYKTNAHTFRPRSKIGSDDSIVIRITDINSCIIYSVSSSLTLVDFNAASFRYSSDFCFSVCSLFFSIWFGFFFCLVNRHFFEPDFVHNRITFDLVIIYCNFQFVPLR